jgi:hypothetical protein
MPIAIFRTERVTLTMMLAIVTRFPVRVLLSNFLMPDLVL